MTAITYMLDNVEQKFADVIPPRSVRESLPLDSAVKLIFVSPDPLLGERMWVIVHERLPDGRYRGELNNDPDVIELRCGALVTFGPENVLAIWNDAHVDTLLAAGLVTRTH